MRLRHGNSQEARKFARDIALYGKPAKLGKCFSKLLDYHFSCFAKKIKIAITIDKPLEMFPYYCGV